MEHLAQCVGCSQSDRRGLLQRYWLTGASVCLGFVGGKFSTPLTKCVQVMSLHISTATSRLQLLLHVLGETADASPRVSDLN
jgi:hypothetical protein